MTPTRALARLALTIALGAGALACRPPMAPPAPGLESIKGSEGLVIDADGAVYFSQPLGVGRRSPDGRLEAIWVPLPGATQVAGLALDRARGVLYAGSPTTSTIYRITLGPAPAAGILLRDAGVVNGLTMGPDGLLYYTDFTDAGHVYSVTADGQRKKVSFAPIEKPNGLAFGPDGALYVDVFSAGSIIKLKLVNGVESVRDQFVSPGRAPDADGIAFDAENNAYIGYRGGVARVLPDGHGFKMLTRGPTANLEFGAGAIAKTDLYAATMGQIVRIPVGVPGADVPWHAAKP